MGLTSKSVVKSCNLEILSYEFIVLEYDVFTSKNNVKMPEVKNINIVKHIKVILFLARDLKTSLNRRPIFNSKCLVYYYILHI